MLCLCSTRWRYATLALVLSLSIYLTYLCWTIRSVLPTTFRHRTDTASDTVWAIGAGRRATGDGCWGGQQNQPQAVASQFR
jgi:hypothetical protein